MGGLSGAERERIAEAVDQMALERFCADVSQGCYLGISATVTVRGVVRMESGDDWVEIVDSKLGRIINCSGNEWFTERAKALFTAYALRHWPAHALANEKGDA